MVTPCIVYLLSPKSADTSWYLPESQVVSKSSVKLFGMCWSSSLVSTVTRTGQHLRVGELMGREPGGGQGPCLTGSWLRILKAGAG